MLRYVILAALALCLILTSAAMADTKDFTFARNSGGDGYIVTKYSGSDSAVTVPDWYNGLPVTEIGSSAFQGNTAIASVSLPSTIEGIGAAAFKGCTNLNKVTSYTASAEPPAAEHIPGDADNNGTVNAYDALLVLQYDAGWNIPAPEGDINGDGAVDINDAVLILQYCADGN